MMNISRRISRLICAMCVVGASPVAAGVYGWELPSAATVARPNLAPDLVIESVTVSPANPQPFEDVSVTIVARNVGNATAWAPEIELRGYVDPGQRPPTAETPPFGLLGVTEGIAPGESRSITLDAGWFDTIACGHAAYGAIDILNDVAESNEGNNVAGVSFCVGPQAVGQDIFEPGDNSCAGASPIAVGTRSPTHTFAPAGDQDWFVFDGFAGVQYVVSLEPAGSVISGAITVQRACPAVATFGGGGTISTPYTPPANGPVFVRARNLLSTINDTAYTLQVSLARDCAGFFEPNDTRLTGSALVAGDPAQRHTFCAANDDDWFRISVSAGTTLIVRVSPEGSQSSPLAFLLSDGAATGVAGNTITITSVSETTRYVRVARNGSGLGISGAYSVSAALANTCAPDAFEPDDFRLSAFPITVDGPPREATFCPRGDVDWSVFTATAGTAYAVEAAWIGASAEPVICLVSSASQNLACDEGSPDLRSSRVAWTAQSGGPVYVRARSADPLAAGGETRYRLAVSSGPCRADTFEPDSDIASAPILAPDGVTQLRSFCPAGDVDRARLVAPVSGVYSVRTTDLMPGSDTRLELRDRDGATLIAANDDDGYSLSSGIVATLTSPGTYFVAVRNFNPARQGIQTGYSLSASLLRILPGPTTTPPPPTAAPTGTPAATTAPPPTPIPAATPVPQEAAAKSVILTNRSRLLGLYGPTRTAALINALAVLADHPSVAGEIILADENPMLAQVYSDWAAQPLAPERANAVTLLLRSLIVDRVQRYPSLRYLVIVGDDRVVPFHRSPDWSDLANTDRFDEKRYAASIGLSAGTELGAALHQNYYPTDDYLSDRQPLIIAGREIFAPDLATGRLIETPEQIAATIMAFVDSPVVPKGRSLVASGHSNFASFLDTACALITADALAGELPDCSLTDHSGWSKASLTSRQFSATHPYGAQFLGLIGAHDIFTTANGESVTAGSVTAAAVMLTRTVVYLSGSHAGLNLPESSNRSLDLAEAYSGRGATFLAPSGWAKANRITNEYAKKLAVLFVEELRTGTSATVGLAAAKAKARFLAELAAPDGDHVKTSEGLIVYGLPMLSVETSGFYGAPFPGVVLTASLPVNGPETPGREDAAGLGALSIRLSASGLRPDSSPIDAYTVITSPNGTAYELSGHTAARQGDAIQPAYFSSLPPPAGQSLKGMLLTAADYVTVTSISLIARSAVGDTDVLSDGSDASGPSAWPGFKIEGADSLSPISPTVFMLMGQSDPARGEQRLFTSLDFAVYYGASEDSTPPDVSSVDGYYDSVNQFANFKLKATDASGVARVVVAYTLGTGAWRTFDLAHRAETGTWQGIRPRIEGAAWYAQVVDGAGNVTVIAPRRGFFDLVSAESEGTLPAGPVFVPLVTR